MKTSWTRAGARALKFLVVFSLSFSGHLAPAYSFSDAWPKEASTDQDLPGKASADPFHLTKQRWDLGTRRSKLKKLYDIFGLTMDPNAYEVAAEKPPTFDKFLVEIEDGHLVVREAQLASADVDDENTDAANLRVKEGGASHHFDSIKPLRWSVDKDLLVVVDTEGVVHAIDMHLLRGVAYRAPVPVFKITQLDNVADLGDAIETRFVSERDWRLLNNKPRANGLYPLDRPPDHRWHAGDFAILKSTAQKSEVVMELDRSVMLNQISAYESILAYWADLLHPVAKNTVGAEVNAEIPAEAALALRNLDKDTLHRLIPNAETWAFAALAPRDQFKMLGENRFGVPTVETLPSRITPKAMLAIAGAALGGAALAAAMEHFGLDAGFTHAVHIVFDNLKILLPPVLTDTSYRHTLMKGMFWLYAAAPAMWATAALFGRLTGRKEDPKVTWVRAGIRTFAKVNQPFWRPLARLLGQPHIIKALSLGVFRVDRQIAPDSRLGQAAGLVEPTRMGWVSPLKFGEERRKVVAQTAKLLRAYEDHQKERIAFARWLALTVVAKETNFDPASIAAQEEETDPAVRRTDAKMNMRRRELAYQLARNLAERKVVPDELNAAEFERELERARFAAQRLGERDLPDVIWDRARFEWNRLSSGTLRGLYDFARAENEFWSTAEPSKTISTRAWSIFVTDYYWGVAYTALYGPRADLMKPADLLAQENALANISPGGRFDTLDTPRWYTLNHNAKITAVFMSTKFKPDPAYQPREVTTLAPQYREPPPWEAFVDFAKDFFNPSTGNYAETLFDQLRVACAMAQTSYILTTGARVLFAGSSFETSSLNFVYHFIWGHIGVGLIWDFINRSIERMEERIGRNQADTQRAMNAIGQGVRLEDSDLYAKGVAQMLELYKRAPRKLSEDLQRQLDVAAATPPDLIQLQQANELMLAAWAEPPLPGKVPQWIKRGAYLLGVGVSTYLGLKMSVATFAEHVDWSYLIGSSLAYVAVIYPSVWILNKAWRTYEKKGAKACESFLAPQPYRDPARVMPVHDRAS